MSHKKISATHLELAVCEVLPQRLEDLDLESLRVRQVARVLRDGNVAERRLAYTQLLSEALYLALQFQ